MKEQKGNILLKAHELINGERNASYGSFGDNVERIQDLMSAMTGKSFSADDVHCFFISLKLCRRGKDGFTTDTLTDLAGYAGLINDNQKGQESSGFEDHVCAHCSKIIEEKSYPILPSGSYHRDCVVPAHEPATFGVSS
jgi:hypothetical protein